MQIQKKIVTLRRFYPEIYYLSGILFSLWLITHPAELGTWLGTVCKNIELIINR